MIWGKRQGRFLYSWYSIYDSGSVCSLRFLHALWIKKRPDGTKANLCQHWNTASSKNEDEMREKLTKEYNLKSLATFPQIIIDGENIGGYSDLIDKYNNNLISFD